MIQIRPREGSKSRTFCRIYFRAEGGGRLEERGREPEGRSESYCREIVIVNLARRAGRATARSGGSGGRGPSLTNEGAGLFINLVSSRLLGQISLPAAVTPRRGEGRPRLREPRAKSTKPRGGEPCARALAR